MFARNRNSVQAIIGAAQFRPFRLAFHRSIESVLFESLGDQWQVENTGANGNLARTPAIGRPAASASTSSGTISRLRFRSALFENEVLEDETTDVRTTNADLLRQNLLVCLLEIPSVVLD